MPIPYTEHMHDDLPPESAVLRYQRAMLERCFLAPSYGFKQHFQKLAHDEINRPMIHTSDLIPDFSRKLRDHIYHACPNLGVCPICNREGQEL